LRKTKDRNIKGFSVDVSKKTTNSQMAKKQCKQAHNNNYTNSNAKREKTVEGIKTLEAKVQAIKSIR
jgi:hypothetical protein